MASSRRSIMGPMPDGTLVVTYARGTLSIDWEYMQVAQEWLTRKHAWTPGLEDATDHVHDALEHARWACNTDDKTDVWTVSLRPEDLAWLERLSGFGCGIRAATEGTALWLTLRPEDRCIEDRIMARAHNVGVRQPKGRLHLVKGAASTW